MEQTQNTCHIFFVQSLLSKLVCDAIVLTESINPKATYYICDRGVPLPKGQNGIELNESWCGPYFLPSKNIFASRKRLLNLDMLINRATGGKTFLLYVNEMTRDFISLFSTHRSCIGINIYEEGFAAYSRSLTRGVREKTNSKLALLKGKVLSYLCFGNRYFRVHHFYHDWYKIAYCTSTDAFVGFPRRRIVNLRAVLENTECPLSQEIPAESVIFSLWPLSPVYGRGNKQENITVFFLALEKVDSVRNRVFVKRHPGCSLSADEWQSIVQRAKKLFPNLEIIVLENTANLEVIFYKRPDLNLVTAHGSTAIYASRFGAKVFIKTNDYKYYKSQSPVSLIDKFVHLTSAVDIAFLT